MTITAAFCPKPSPPSNTPFHDKRLVYNIAILGIHIEEIALVNALGSVTNTFTWHNASETMLHAIKNRGPDTSTSRATNDDACIHADGPQIAGQIGTEESRRILFHKHTVSRMWGHTVINLHKRIVFGPSAQQGNFLRENATIRWMLKVDGGVENRDAFGTSQLNQRF
eukprot:Skav215528  [mRNA]  locus=scaffold219:196788:197431:- [translate_table: standard]